MKFNVWHTNTKDHRQKKITVKYLLQIIMKIVFLSHKNTVVQFASLYTQLFTNIKTICIGMNAYDGNDDAENGQLIAMAS